MAISKGYHSAKHYLEIATAPLAFAMTTQGKLSLPGQEYVDPYFFTITSYLLLHKKKNDLQKQIVFFLCWRYPSSRVVKGLSCR